MCEGYRATRAEVASRRFGPKLRCPNRFLLGLFGGRLEKPNAGEVAERLKAAVC